MLKLVNPEPESGTIIKIIGIGGAGVQAVEHMMSQGLSGVEFIAADTDAQVLAHAAVPQKLELHDAGKCSGTSVAVAKRDRDAMRVDFEEAHLLFIVAGMGGGTGTDAASEIASIAREMNILTVAVVTCPFDFEGDRRMKTAKLGIAELVQCSDSVIVIPNEKIMPFMGNDADVSNCFQTIDDLLLHIVGGITGIIERQDLVACDFEDIRTVMSDMGLGSMGEGSAVGDRRAQIAAERAIASPFWGKNDLAASSGIAVIISATRETLKMKEAHEVMNSVKAAIADNANVIFGVLYEPHLGETLRVVVVACGIDPTTRPKTPPPCGPLPPGGIGCWSQTMEALREADVDRLDIPDFLRKAS